MMDKTLDLYLSLAQRQQQEGDLAAAITSYRQAIQAFPQNYQPYNYLGKVLVEQGDLEAAIAIFYQGIELEANISWLYYHLAEALKKQDNLTAAVLNYQKAIELEDDIPWFHFHLGQTLSKQENHTQAINSYQTAIKLGLKDPWVHYFLAESLSQQGDFEAAIDNYHKSIAINPNLSLFYEKIYFLKLKLAQGDSEIITNVRAGVDNKSQVNEATDKIQSLQTQAKLFVEKQELESALRCYQEIIQMDYNYGKIFYQIGNIYEQINQVNTAAEYYRKASILEDFASDSNVLLVCFSARHINPRCRYHFLDLVASFPGKKLFIRDIQDVWYNKGLPGLTQNVEQTAGHLKNIIEQQNVAKVVFLGASSGGYAALLYGYLLQLNEIHAFGAQTQIPNNQEETKLLENIEPTYFNLATVYQGKPITSNCNLYFDNQFPPDVEHAHRLKNIANVKLHGYRAGVGHKIAMWLKHQKLLRPIILNALN